MNSNTKILHQHKMSGAYYETVCGLRLHPDTRTRTDVLLATLLISNDDLCQNFGSDAIKCPKCVSVVGPTAAALQEACSHIQAVSMDSEQDLEDWAGM